MDDFALRMLPRRRLTHSSMPTMLLAAALGLGLLTASTAARADGPNTVRVGLYDLFYHVSSDPLSGPFVPPGELKLDAKNTQTLYLAYVRDLTSHINAELAFGWPPLTKTVGVGPATVGSVPYNGQTIATARWLSPSLVFNYQFFSPHSLVRPYLGVGLNFTYFYDRQSTPAGNAIAGGPTQLSLENSLGPVANVGVRFQLPGAWSAYVSYAFSRVRTHLVADTLGEFRTTNVSFGPQALIASVGYSF
jgi:outer membrane protein